MLHGSYSYVMQDDDGQTCDVHSMSAGLDYPGVGPEHSYWKDTGRVTYTNCLDKDALAAFDALARNEGILAALESSHAVAKAMELARGKPKDHVDRRLPLRPRRQGRGGDCTVERNGEQRMSMPRFSLRAFFVAVAYLALVITRRDSRALINGRHAVFNVSVRYHPQWQAIG